MYLAGADTPAEYCKVTARYHEYFSFTRNKIRLDKVNVLFIFSRNVEIIHRYDKTLLSLVMVILGNIMI